MIRKKIYIREEDDMTLLVAMSSRWQPRHHRVGCHVSDFCHISARRYVYLTEWLTVKKNESSVVFLQEKKYNGQSGKICKVHCHFLQLTLILELGMMLLV